MRVQTHILRAHIQRNARDFLHESWLNRDIDDLMQFEVLEGYRRNRKSREKVRSWRNYVY